jgi:hypothetical protein
MEPARTSIGEQQFGKYILELTQSTIEPPLLSSRLLGFVATVRTNNKRMSEVQRFFTEIRQTDVQKEFNV